MKILRLRDVMAVTGLARSTVYDFINNSDFPKPVQLGDRAVGWVEQEVMTWIEQRVQKRDEALL